VYSVIYPDLLAPHGSFSRGGIYPDAGGDAREPFKQAVEQDGDVVF